MRPVDRLGSGTVFRLVLAALAVLLGGGIALASGGIGPGIVVLSLVAILSVVGVGVALPEAVAKLRTLKVGWQWWHWLWLLAWMSALVFRDRNADAIREEPLDFWAAWRIGLMGVIGLILLTRLATRRSEWSRNLLRGLPAGIFLYGAVCLASTLWSVFPAWTFYKALEYLVDVALLAAVLAAVGKIEQIKSLFDLTWTLYSVMLATVWLGVIIRPDLTVVSSAGPIGIIIVGLIPSISANGVGDLSATLLVVAATRLLLRRTHRGPYWLLFLVALPTMILAQSRSPVGGAMLGLFMVLLLRRRLGLLTVVGLAGAVLLSVTSAETVLQEAVLRGQSVEMFRSLSGRVNWWAPAWEAFRDNPLLGLGGYAAGRFGVLDAIGATEPSSLHNAWLEVLVGVGVVGFLPFLWTVLGTWVTLLRGDPTNAASEVVLALRVEALGVFTLICLRSAFTVEFIWHAPTTFFLILCFAELLRRARSGAAVRRQRLERLRRMPQPALGQHAAVRGSAR